MRKALGLLGVRLAAVLALAVSAALWVDYTSLVPTFCGVDSGCAAVRQSAYAYLALAGQPIPLPAFGLLGFSLLLGAALSNALLRWVPLMAGLAGALGLTLFLVQWVEIGRLCSLCVTVDALSVLALASGLILWRGAGDPKTPLAVRWGAWPALGVIALAAPLVWPRVRPAAPVPAGVQQLYRPGKINVVEFADYQCPYCRRLHPELSALIQSYPGKVNFARLNLPLPSHEYARGAAKAQVCAREQGRGDEMADELFAAEDLRPEANRELARRLGLDLAVFDRCIAGAAADRVIDQESKILIDHGLQGLPTTYVGAKTIIGAQPEAVFRDAFDRAERGEGEQGIPAQVYWLSVLALSAAVIWVARAPRATL